MAQDLFEESILSNACIECQRPFSLEIKMSSEIMADPIPLNTIKSKLKQIGDVLNEILALPPQSFDYPTVLSSLGVLTAKLGALEQDLTDASFQQMLVHPHTLIASDPDLLPRVYLRTKLLPEVERRLDSLLTENGTEPLPDPSQETQIKSALYQLELEIEKENQVVDLALDTLLESLEGTGDPLTAQRPDVKKMLNEQLDWMSSGPKKSL